MLLFLYFCFKKKQKLSAFFRKKRHFYRHTAIQIALIKPWSSLLLLGPQPAGASPGTFFRGCDVLQGREV